MPGPRDGLGEPAPGDAVDVVGADRKGSPCIGAALGEAAASAGRPRTLLGAKLRRLVRRMPGKKAQVAVMRTRIPAAHALLSDPAAEYREVGPGYDDQRAGTQR